MTRVAYVSADLGVPIFGLKGCSIHAQEVLRALVRRGAEVDLFTTSGEGQPHEDLKPVRLHALSRPPKCDLASREQACLAANDSVIETLKSAGPFTFVYERYSLWSFSAMEYARAAGTPGLLEVNAPLIEEQAEHRVLVDRASAQRVAGRVFSAATALIAVSQEVADYLENFPTAQGKVHVIPNGVNPARFPADLKPSLPAGPGMFTIGFVGTLKPWHGLGILLEAFGMFHECRPLTRLLIVGDGPEREKLAAEALARGLSEAVHFTGAVAPDQVPGLLKSMDIAVAPYPKMTRFYFSPLKVYEYMAAGAAVVASDVGQLHQLIVSGVNGLLVPPGDSRALAAAFERLESEPSLRLPLGRAARSLVMREHTWDAVAERILSIARLDFLSRASETLPTSATLEL